MRASVLVSFLLGLCALALAVDARQSYSEFRADIGARLLGLASAEAELQPRADPSERFFANIQWGTCPVPFSLPRSLIGIVTAFSPETFEVVSKMQGQVRTVDKFGRRFYLGKLDGHRVVVVASGVGMTNAAMTTQQLIDEFRVGTLFFSGIAGGVNPAHRVGDVIVAAQWAQNQHHKAVRSQAGTSGFFDFGFDFPEVFLRDADGNVVSGARPSCDGCAEEAEGQFEGFLIPMYNDVLRSGDDAYLSAVPSQFWLPVDADLLAASQRAIDAGIQLTNTGFDPIAQEPFTLPYMPEVKIGTAGVSSSTFVDNAEFREQIFDTFDADVLDMESAAFMHVCESTGVSCIAIRSLSDLAGGEESINTILTFISFAAANSVTTLRAILAQL